MTIDYRETPEFQRDFRKLAKKFPSLPEDFGTAKKFAIGLFHIRGIDNQSVFEIPHLKRDIAVYKLKKFACKSLKGRGNQSGIRIIYAWLPEKNQIHFIEIYHKGSKENENRERIANFLQRLVSDEKYKSDRG